MPTRARWRPSALKPAADDVDCLPAQHAQVRELQNAKLFCAGPAGVDVSSAHALVRGDAGGTRCQLNRYHLTDVLSPGGNHVIGLAVATDAKRRELL